jgi:N-acetylmuramoyl-L-alanine amidase
LNIGNVVRGRRHTGAAIVMVWSLGLVVAGCGDGGRTGSPPASPPTVRPSTPTAQPTSTPAQRPLKGKVVVVDPGHNGANGRHPEIANKPVDVITKRKPCDSTGTQTNDGYTEHSFNWDVANRLAKRLREDGAKVVLTRKSDNGVGPCITRRAAIGNEAKADAALSIHADGAAAGDHGFHIIAPAVIRGYTDKMADDSRRLGLDIRAAFKEGTGLPYSTYRGEQAIDVRDDLGGLNLSTRPKVFVECGNMKNPGDAAKLSSGKFRQRIADALADGITEFLN